MKVELAPRSESILGTGSQVVILSEAKDRVPYPRGKLNEILGFAQELFHWCSKSGSF